ncbi:hypothetical protein K0M31_010506 [Melipona bicolor]|uniref:Uncharacterized protein n=1 Tax=Melipona bicolor TaxID=60889 RepID=A0AA40FL79_9HYME|nr:hypothetical protein K0M31_010506 [Melipona bicolor]
MKILSTKEKNPRPPSMLTERQIENCSLYERNANDLYNLPKDQRIHEKRNSTKSNVQSLILSKPTSLCYSRSTIALLSISVPWFYSCSNNITLTQLTEQTLKPCPPCYVDRVNRVTILSVPIFSTSISWQQ